jgi:RecB family exonuclease
VAGTFQQSFGSTIHKTFEGFLKLYKTNTELTQTDLFGKKSSEAPLPKYEILENLYKKNWIDDWYPSINEKERYRKEGLKIIKIFYESLFPSPGSSVGTKFQPKYIEQFFKLKIGNYDFVGKIDRADFLEGQGIEIIDYKTGKTPKSKTDIDQLHIYQWAAQEILKEKVKGLKYWYLQDNNFIEEQPADASGLVELKKRLLEIIGKIIYTTRHNLFAEEHKKCKEHKCEFEYLE